MHAACTNHLDREAIGICVHCRARVCGECVTKVDGINHCVGCLSALAERSARERPALRTSSRAGRTVSATLLFGVAVLMAWGLLEAALPGGG